MNLSEIKSLLRSIRWRQMRLESDMQYLQMLEAAAERAAEILFSRRVNISDLIMPIIQRWRNFNVEYAAES